MRHIMEGARGGMEGGRFNPGPWVSGGFVTHRGHRYRLWHVPVAASAIDAPKLDPSKITALGPGGRGLIDASWGIVVSDRVSPRGTTYILDHVPTLVVATGYQPDR